MHKRYICIGIGFLVGLTLARAVATFHAPVVSERESVPVTGASVLVTDASVLVTDASIQPKEVQKLDLYCTDVKEGSIEDYVFLDFGRIVVSGIDGIRPPYSIDVDDRILRLSDTESGYVYNFIRVSRNSMELSSLDVFGRVGYEVRANGTKEKENSIRLKYKIYKNESIVDDMKLYGICLSGGSENYDGFTYYVLEEKLENKSFVCSVEVGNFE